MDRERTAAQISAWKADDGQRNERARIERLRRDGQRSPSENLAEGIALARATCALFGAAVDKRSA